MSDSQIVRPYGDTTGDGMVQLSFTLPIPHDKVAEGAAVQLANKMGMDPALVVHGKPMGDGLHVLRRLRPGQPPRRHRQGRGRRARLPAADAQGGQRGRQAGPAPPAGRRRRLHRHRRAHRRHRRDPQHQGVRGGEGPGVLPRAQGREPRRPGLGARSSSSGPGRRRPTRCSSPRWSPSATRTCSTPARCRAAFREAYPAEKRPLLVVGGPRFDEAMAAELGVDRIFARGTTPGEVASFLVDRIAPSERRPDDRDRPRGHHAWCTAATCPTPTPTTPATSSTAPTRSGLFGDVATEMCIRTDGDEGLFASYSDVQFLAARARRRRPRDHLHADPGRHPQPGARPRRPRGGPRGGDRRTARRRGGARRAAPGHHAPPAPSWSRRGSLRSATPRLARSKPRAPPSACRRTTRREGKIWPFGFLRAARPVDLRICAFSQVSDWLTAGASYAEGSGVLLCRSRSGDRRPSGLRRRVGSHPLVQRGARTRSRPAKGDTGGVRAP